MVYFVLRSEYELPHGRRIIEFPDETIVEWFQKHWLTKKEILSKTPNLSQRLEYDPWECQDEILELHQDKFGGSFYGLCEFLIPMLKKKPPENMKEVAEFIASFEGSYSEGTIEIYDSGIQAITDDDEIEIAWYLFDSDFIDRFPERTSFLLQKKFKLPEDVSDKAWDAPIEVKTLGDGSDSTYCCFFSAQDGMTITDIEGCYSLPARLPKLGALLAQQSIDTKLNEFGRMASEWPDELLLLRAFSLMAKTPSLKTSLQNFDQIDQELAGWLPRIFSSFDYENKKSALLTGNQPSCREELASLTKRSRKAGEKAPNHYWADVPVKSSFQFSKHICQAIFRSKHVAFDDPSNSFTYVKHWIFFDTLWAAANPILAEGILRYGRGEDVLGD